MTWQPFGYRGAPGTCLWCGRRLRREQVQAVQGDPGARELGRGFWTRPAAQLGSYQDDSFCGLRCGYQFGLWHARQGSRMFLGGRRGR